MRTNIFIVLAIWLSTMSCEEESFNQNSLAEVNGLDLYWDHEVFGKEGRRLRFVFSTIGEMKTEENLYFDYIRHENDIIIEVHNKPVVDPDSNPESIQSKDIDNKVGRISIPENMLNGKSYNLIIKTAGFEINSKLEVNKEKYILTIPDNDYVFSDIKEVYPIPKNILFCRVNYTGYEKYKFLYNLYDNYRHMGLKEISLPNYPYKHLVVDNTGKPKSKQTQPGTYSIGELFQFKGSFKRVVELSKKFHKKAEMDFYLFTSNGDEAILSKVKGEYISYSN